MNGFRVTELPGGFVRTSRQHDSQACIGTPGQHSRCLDDHRIHRSSIFRLKLVILSPSFLDSFLSSLPDRCTTWDYHLRFANYTHPKRNADHFKSSGRQTNSTLSRVDTLYETSYVAKEGVSLHRTAPSPRPVGRKLAGLLSSLPVPLSTAPPGSLI